MTIRCPGCNEHVEIYHSNDDGEDVYSSHLEYALVDDSRIRVHWIDLEAHGKPIMVRCVWSTASVATLPTVER